MASPSSFIHFDQQVAGHNELMKLPTNDLILIKPVKKKELLFYENVHTFPDFLDFIPECYGTIRAATESDVQLLDNSSLKMDKIVIDKGQDQNLCLENLLNGFSRPCIIDLKMGSLLYDQDATEEKRNRMIRNANTTTSGTLGLKISGLKIYDTVERKYARYPKAFGSSRTPETVLDALLAFLYPHSDYGLKTAEYRQYEDDPTEMPDELVIKKRLPLKYTKWVIESFIDTIKEIRHFIIQHPQLRLIGSSILMIYEGDRAAADKTWKFMLDDDNKGDAQKNEEEEEEELEPKMCELRLIDFAHSDWDAKREEQDPGLIKGYDNIIDLLEKCLEINPYEKAQ